MKLFVIFGLILSVGIVILSVFSAPEKNGWHQKLMLEIDTPAGSVSGDSVVAVGVSHYSDATANFGTEVGYSTTGEATVVEVTSGHYLFALISGSEDRFSKAAAERFRGLSRKDSLREIPRQTEPVTLTGVNLPMLVTFDNLLDPTTVRQVNPNDLESIFGIGVKLRSVELQITAEPVTEGRVDVLLPWLSKYPEPHLMKADGRATTAPFAMTISHGDFKRRPQ